jgi:integrase/recombinase XerD
MTDPKLLSPWVRRFLMEHIICERNLALNTQRSYRDTLRLLLPFVASAVGKPIDRLEILDLSSSQIRAFLLNLEDKRKCGVATRNQRLAAIHSLAQFIALHSPEHIQWCGELKNIPVKKAPRSQVTYLEKKEMDALLAAPDQTTAQGQRDGISASVGRRAMRVLPPSFTARATNNAIARSGRGQQPCWLRW